MSTPPHLRPPRPHPDPDSAPFWEGTRQHRLLVQRCEDCGSYRFPPRPVCGRCSSRQGPFVPVSGRGRVLSWVVTHQPFLPAFADRLPYVVLAVELAEQAGLLMYGNLRPEDAPVAAGMAVRAVFENIEDAGSAGSAGGAGGGFTLVQWAPGS